MIQQQDSIHTLDAAEGEVQQSATKHFQLTPKMVLSWLPKDATPAQQDSAIQAHFKPSEIHWSNMPDTLHLPGHTAGRSYKDVSLPQYYKESFFAKDSLFHPELQGGRLGVAGDPVPYTVAGDNFLTSLLLFCFVLASVSLAQSHEFIIRQAKNFFRPQRTGTTEMTETTNEVRFQCFLVLQTCLLIGVGYFLYTNTLYSDTYTIDQNLVICMYSGVVAAYFLLKALFYTIVDGVFFGGKINGQWMKSYIFLASSEGVLLFPAVMLLTYFGLSMHAVAIYSLIVVITVKILSFYKSHLIFFNGKGNFLQIILYFCALEMMPLFTLWGGLVLMSHYLKVNY